MLRADLWTTKLLLLWAASLGVYYSTAKRSRSKIKTEGDPWTRGCTRWIYSGDTVMEAGERAFLATEDREWTNQKGSALSTNHKPALKSPSASCDTSSLTVPKWGTWRQITLKIVVLQLKPPTHYPLPFSQLWHNVVSHYEPQNQKYGTLVRKWENLIIGWICALKAASVLAETSASSQKSIFDFLVLILEQSSSSLIFYGLFNKIVSI